MVACYVSLPEEPGTTQLIDALRETGIQVLLPVLHGYPDWALFSGWEHTVPAWRGILQPDTEQLGVEALRRADLVIAPALSVARDGTRLGTGGGWYDRALPHRRTNAPVWSLIRSAELRDQLPRMPHDVPVDAVITERGFHQLR